MIENIPDYVRKFFRQHNREVVIQDLGLLGCNAILTAADGKTMTLSFGLMDHEYALRRLLMAALNVLHRRDTDYYLEQAWEKLADVPIDEDECIEQAFYVSLPHWNNEFRNFHKGTDRMDIWHFFDQNHSKGLAWLMGFNKVE